MAYSALTYAIAGSPTPVSYTVPANKIFVGRIYLMSPSGGAMAINGIVLSGAVTGSVQPVAAGAGDVISISGGSATGSLNGLLQDN